MPGIKEEYEKLRQEHIKLSKTSRELEKGIENLRNLVSSVGKQMERIKGWINHYEGEEKRD